MYIQPCEQEGFWQNRLILNEPSLGRDMGVDSVDSTDVTEAVEMVISTRERDIGGFTVRRLLPYVSRRMVGPFVFFDHMGPADFDPGQGLDVRPHPHINLATVTYLFEGVILHRDSLGIEQPIEPGAINWMTAGRGIVHSERTPERLRRTGSRMNGIQLWVALPEEHEETDPCFTHHPADQLPEFQIDGVRIKLLLGEVLGYRSPVPVHSQLFYFEAHFSKGQALSFPRYEGEAAAYVVDGSAKVGDKKIGSCSMAIFREGEEFVFEALEDSHVMFLGGSSLGRRHIYWNFVSSSRERIEDAKADWLKGPGAAESRFMKVPGDDAEYIPLPEAPTQGANPKGTIM